jgi:hypothetical protein
MRVQFDTTLEEVVDLNMRLSEQTKTFQRSRRRSQIFVGASAGVAGLIGPLTDDDMPTALLAIMFIIASLFAGTCGYAYGRFHTWYIRRNCRKVLREMLHEAERIPVEIELRAEGLWARSPTGDCSLPWSRLKRVNDGQDGVDFWFDPGLVVVRDRAFASPDDRRRFIAKATELSGVKS